MPNSLQDTLREVLISSLEGAGNASGNGAEQAPETSEKSGGMGHKGLAAGVGMAALAPVAMKGLSKLAREAGMSGVKDLVSSPAEAVEGLGGSAVGKLGSTVTDKVGDAVEDQGGAGGILSDTVKKLNPFGGDSGTKGGAMGVGKGRRMPVQQAIDIGRPIETVYNQWTQFEEWPQFMHRVIRASQEEDNQVTIVVKMWTRTREFTAEIDTQRPNDLIKWKVTQGISHTGVVSFHELAPNMTRVLVSIDVQPGGMIEKMARGMRHIKRASRGDFHRFKAYIEMAGMESGAWRGVIEDGEVVEEHDPAYDEERQYVDTEDVIDQLDDAEEESKDSDDDEEDEDQDQDKEQEKAEEPAAEGEEEEQAEEERPRATRRRRQSQSSNGHGSDEEKSSSRGGSRSGQTKAASRSGSSRSSSGRSSSGRSSSSRSSSSKSSSSGRSGSSRSSGTSGSRRSSNGSGSSSSGGSSSSRRTRSRSRGGEE